MAVEEQRAWIMGVVTIVAYAVYAVIILSRDGALVDVPYVVPMLWTIGAAIVASIVLHIVVSIASGESSKRDQRDREIERFGDHVGQSFVVIGAIAALILAMVEADHFWIANAVYLGFALSGVLGSMARISAYRVGFQAW
ncbi:hypothetical protein [Actinokineospora sp. HUAS TT18]|uniref:hypothetical protein n=1 Tax=Actinokineospora sp. HUAS TT18 TaxID=3447451 RepID=UPI003F521A43